MKQKKSIKFAKLELSMVYSAAYQDLNAPSLKMLSYLLLQLRWVNVARSKSKPRYELENSDRIEMAYATFKNNPFKMKNATISRAIDSLLAHGFIKVKKQGGACKGNKTTFEYSQEWRNWRPGDVIFKRRPYVGRGFCKR